MPVHFSLRFLTPSFLFAQIKTIKQAQLPDVDLSQLGTTQHGSFTVEVIDPVADYLWLLQV